MHELSLQTDRKTQLIEITDLVREALGETNGAAAARGRSKRSVH